ncbi:MAG: DUF4139 domain-containing protein [Treponema sp.]|jgi:hypothetical protein|nr:DUF4139 domain-containing protein [Treponema sp.]
MKEKKGRLWFPHGMFLPLIALMALGPGASGINAQSIRDESGGNVLLPLKKITLFSSGLAYYEHRGALNGQGKIALPFKTGSISDALKSLVLNDPASANPSVTYQSEQTLLQTLKSLRIDLSDEPDMALILTRLRGAEVEIAAPSPINGRIVGVENRGSISPDNEALEQWLSVYTAAGLKLINLKEIASLNFKDSELNRDIGRALDLIAASRNSDSRDLVVTLPGNGSRQVSISYVIPAPVWKVSYRLDLGTGGGGEPLFQGWAIVDNDGDTDWREVELSLAAGRPASFIQNLYPPYYLSRPVLPLAIAGAAAAETHGTGYAVPAPAPRMMMKREILAEEAEYDAVVEEYKPSYEQSVALDGGAIQGASGAAAGDQFEFTIKKPVSLDRRMSAMLPLVESKIAARKLLIFSGANAYGRNIHPRLGAEITNTTGMKLPAGPITVYDGGTYAGDALIEFWNEDEKRLISFGEDLSVTGTIIEANSRTIAAVHVADGILSISRSQDYIKNYAFKNVSTQSRQILVEHPKTQGAALEAPEADEQTPSAYRFTMTLPAAREITLIVREARPVMERVTLLQLRPEAFLSYASSQEIPPAVRGALRQAMDMKRAVSLAEAAVIDAENRRSFLVEEQDRIRKNLEAAGSQTQQGQEYLKRLVSLDDELDRLTPEIEKFRTGAKTAQKAYEDYLNGLRL